ncbi:DHHC palmitoyltransferase-domain-containing protein, partial [Blyttiomyces helicus]
KHCDTCRVWRPPRTSHCSQCDRCVFGHDHHCPWMGNCVGRRNYRYFFAFLAATAVLSTFVLSVSIAHVVALSHADNAGFWDEIGRHP